MRFDQAGRWTRPRVALWATLLGAAALAGGGAGCAADNGIVGGGCAAGYVDCDNQCIPVMDDPNNCGACAHVCASGSCVSGSCSIERDAGAHGDASAHGDARSDGGSNPQKTQRPDARVSPPGEGGASSDSASDAPPGRDGSRADGSGASEAGPSDSARPDVASDAAHVDSRAAEGGSVEASSGDAAPRGDAARVDATSADATLGGTTDAGALVCVPPYVSVSSCGECDLACSSGEVCAPSEDGGVVSYACASACPSPLMACGGSCVDSNGDPQNCGGCGVACASGICTSGKCTGSAAGDIVVIGHDYASASVRMSEATILSNAVFLPPSNPLRVLSFEQYAAASEVAHVKSVLAAASLSSGRSVTLTRMTDYTLVPGALASPSFDVLLVYDQGAAPAGTLGAVGQSWQSAVTRFVGAGGDVVVLDGASGSSPQMTDFLSSASLLQTTGEVPISPGAPLLVVASGDAVGNFVVSPYAAQSDTVCFVTSEPNGGDVTYVVDELDGPSLLPVVIHKTVGGP